MIDVTNPTLASRFAFLRSAVPAVYDHCWHSAAYWVKIIPIISKGRDKTVYPVSVHLLPSLDKPFLCLEQSASLFCFSGMPLFEELVKLLALYIVALARERVTTRGDV